MEELIILLLVVSTLANVVQVALAWFTLKEVGDLDTRREDWWEKLEDRWSAARRLRGAVSYMRGKAGPK
jgi:hypothetical protein